jgi:hypothetical protein
MVKNQLIIRAAAAAGLVGLVLAVYFLWARPFQLQWGATAAETRMPMPGDELNTSPTFLATRAITIDAAPAQVWPWLVQIGYGRAGFYGYDIFENVGSPRGLSSADRILPEFQHFNVGDPVPISSVASMSFYAIEPDRYLVWAGKTGGTSGVFTWALYPIDASHTRLVSRIRWSHHWSQPGILALDLLTEFTDHLAVRKVLQGVKGRVEGNVEPAAIPYLEFFTFLGVLFIWIGMVIGVVARPFTWRGWRMGLLAGAGWLITWYGPVPVWVGALVTVLAVVGMVWGRGTAIAPHPHGPRQRRPHPWRRGA